MQGAAWASYCLTYRNNLNKLSAHLSLRPYVLARLASRSCVSMTNLNEDEYPDETDALSMDLFEITDDDYLISFQHARAWVKTGVGIISKILFSTISWKVFLKEVQFPHY